MNYRPLSLVIGLALGSPIWVSADSIGERMTRMEAMMAEMQKEMDIQKATIRQQATTIAEQKAHLDGTPPHAEKLTEDIEAKQTADTEGKAPWYRTIEIAGAVEVEAARPSLTQENLSSAEKRLRLFITENYGNPLEVVETPPVATQQTCGNEPIVKRVL